MGSFAPAENLPLASTGQPFELPFVSSVAMDVGDRRRPSIPG